MYKVISVASLFMVSASPSFAQDEPKATGLQFLDEATYRSIPLATTPLMGDLPADFDMSADFPDPGQQGGQASCVGWAAAALKGYQEQQERRWGFASSNGRFSPSFIYNQIKLGGTCRGGSYLTEALNVLRRDGAALSRDFPYIEDECSLIPSPAIKQSARNYSVADWRRVNVQDEIELKTQLASGFPILIGMMVDSNFQRLAPGAVHTSFSGTPLGGHAMVVVGYSDVRRAFKVINSWGQQWGDGGFGWIDYGAFRGAAREGYVVQDVIVQRPVHVPTPTPGPMPTTPFPVPVQTQAIVSLSSPVIAHNQTVPSPIGPQPGMRIQLQGRVQNGTGRQFQIITRFNYLGGNALLANPQETTFRDITGLVATGSMPTAIGTDDENLNQVSLTIPYYALNFVPTGGTALYNLSMNVIAFVDNQPIAQSPHTPFQIRW